MNSEVWTLRTISHTFPISVIIGGLTQVPWGPRGFPSPLLWPHWEMRPYGYEEADMGWDSDTQLSSRRGGVAGFLMASWEHHMDLTQGWGRLEAASPLTSSCPLYQRFLAGV